MVPGREALLLEIEKQTEPGSHYLNFIMQGGWDVKGGPPLPTMCSALVASSLGGRIPRCNVSVSSLLLCRM